MALMGVLPRVLRFLAPQRVLRCSCMLALTLLALFGRDAAAHQEDGADVARSSWKLQPLRIAVIERVDITATPEQVASAMTAFGRPPSEHPIARSATMQLEHVGIGIVPENRPTQ